VAPDAPHEVPPGSTDPFAAAATLTAPLVALVDRLQRENLELAGRVGLYQAENQRLLSLVAPTAAAQPRWGRLERVLAWLAP
jgi:hypothetical protein